MSDKELLEKFQLEPTNQFQLDGDVVQCEDGKAVVKVMARGRSDTYENLLEVTVPDDAVGADMVKPGKRLSFLGEIVRQADSEEPILRATDIDKTSDYFNLAQALVKVAGCQFFKGQPKTKKPQFASLFGDTLDEENPNTVSAVAFRGLSASVKDLAQGSLMMFGGALRRKAFNDGSGRWSTDIILDPQYTEIYAEAEKKGFRKPKKQAKPAKTGKAI
jgi:hypothetical protein